MFYEVFFFPSYIIDRLSLLGWVIRGYLAEVGMLAHRGLVPFRDRYLPGLYPHDLSSGAVVSKNIPVTCLVYLIENLFPAGLCFRYHAVLQPIGGNVLILC